MTFSHLLILSAIIFVIGLYGALTRKSAIQMYMSIELMFNAVNLNFITFAYFSEKINLQAHIFVLFIITVAAVEAAAGLAIILALYKHKKTTNADKANILKH